MDGTFEVVVGDSSLQLSKENHLSTVIPARTPHKIRALTAGSMLTVTLGQVVRAVSTSPPGRCPTFRC